jgi:hypothetical protein
MSSESVAVLAKLKEYGLLLQTDAKLPNVCALVAGAQVHGSWWAHPLSHEIFRVNCELVEHPDVLVCKLISGKITYVHRPLWPAVVAIGRARESWQMERLSRGARRLLAEVDREPIQTDGRVSKAASELERNILVYSEQFHAEAGAHARRLESWDCWAKRTGYIGERITVVRAKVVLEEVVGELNRRFGGRGRLPWWAVNSGTGCEIPRTATR